MKFLYRLSDKVIVGVGAVNPKTGHEIANGAGVYGKDPEFYTIDTNDDVQPKSQAEVDAIKKTRIMAEVLSKINQEVNAYICLHYDMGTQASMQAIYIMDTTPAEVKTALLTVWAWVTSVLSYYYSKKSEIQTSLDPGAVTWDFSQFDATDPVVSLQTLLA